MRPSVKGDRIDGVPVSLFERRAFLRPERGLSAAPRAGAVKPDRRSPPEAARSGRGARLARLGRSRRRGRRANMMPDWASSKRGLAASPCIRSGAVARNPNPSCNDEGAAHERRDPSERAEASPWMRAVTRRHGSPVRGSDEARRCRDDAGLEIAPQRHHQPARQRDDGDAPHRPLASPTRAWARSPDRLAARDRQDFLPRRRVGSRPEKDAPEL